MTNSIDQTIGRKIRQLRWKTGTTHEQLADAVRVSSEELQHYERGVTRVSVQNLCRITEFFDVPITALFDFNTSDASADLNVENILSEVFSDPEAMKLVRLYYSLSDDERRKTFQAARRKSGM
jgi:transcriptional regulator with XRE-family HTH domain